MSNTGSVDRVNVCAAFSRAFHFSPRLYLICKDSGTKEENEESFVRKPPARLLTRANLLRIPRLRILDRQKRESVKWRDSNLTGTYRSRLSPIPINRQCVSKPSNDEDRLFRSLSTESHYERPYLFFMQYAKERFCTNSLIAFLFTSQRPVMSDNATSDRNYSFFFPFRIQIMESKEISGVDFEGNDISRPRNTSFREIKNNRPLLLMRGS